AHTTLLPFLARWPYAELDPALRRSFEVALHTGAGIALAGVLPAWAGGRAAICDRRRAHLIALACLPPAGAGYAFAGAIERPCASPARAPRRGTVWRSSAAAARRSAPRSQARGCSCAANCSAARCCPSRSTGGCSRCSCCAGCAVAPPRTPHLSHNQNTSRMTVLGTLLGGRYRLDAQIGRGGMSTVYRAFDTVLERPVAIKLMHREIASDSDQLERFRREARAVA